MKQRASQKSSAACPSRTVNDNNKAGLIYHLLKVHTFILFKVRVLFFLTALGSREKKCFVVFMLPRSFWWLFPVNSNKSRPECHKAPPSAFEVCPTPMNTGTCLLLCFLWGNEMPANFLLSSEPWPDECRCGLSDAPLSFPECSSCSCRRGVILVFLLTSLQCILCVWNVYFMHRSF